MVANVKVKISRQLKRVPPVFDFVRHVTRTLGATTPVYQRLREIISRRSEVKFVQIGSNDGISVDPLREFIVAGGGRFQGAFVEPIPQVFDLLRRNYAYLRNPHLKFFNVAVGAEGGTRVLWNFKEDCLRRLPPFAYQIASFDRDHLIKHFPNEPHINEYIESLKVPCMTLSEIQRAAGLGTLDILHLDVEGAEAEILRTIDLTEVRPTTIIFEISHMSGDARNEIFSLLEHHGYEVVDCGIDSVATLRSCAEPKAFVY